MLHTREIPEPGLNLKDLTKKETNNEIAHSQCVIVLDTQTYRVANPKNNQQNITLSLALPSRQAHWLKASIGTGKAALSAVLYAHPTNGGQFAARHTALT